VSTPNVVRVNLTEPHLRIIATSSLSGPHRQRVQFAQRASVAINGDYFDLDLQPIGLAMGDGRVWAEASESIRRQEVVGVGDRRVQILLARAAARTRTVDDRRVSGWPMVVDDCEPVAGCPAATISPRAASPQRRGTLR